MLLDLLTLITVAEAAALTASTETRAENMKVGHGTIWKKAEKKDNNFVMTKDHITSRYSLDKPYQVIIPAREERKTGPSG